jgi:hypothetical protein
MAGIIAVYALVIAVLIAQDLNPPSQANYSLFKYVRAWPKSSLFRRNLYPEAGQTNSAKALYLMLTCD